VRRALLLALVAALALPAAAGAGVRNVTLPGNFFSPQRINIVVGDDVRWTNHSPQNHNMKDVSHGSTPLFEQTVAPHQVVTTPPGTFTAQETVEYICTIHANMKGTIGVWNLWLGTPPTIVAGNSVTFTGLAAAGRTVQMQTGGGTPVGPTDVADANGVWAISIPKLTPGTYRATDDGASLSRDVRLNVKPRLTFTKKRVRAGVWSLVMTLAPNQAGGKAVLDKRGRYGWVKVAAKTVGTASKATFQAKFAGASMRFRLRLAQAVNGYSPTIGPAFTLKR
jgi:plastocyanin